MESSCLEGNRLRRRGSGLTLSPPNAILPSPPLVYLSPGGIKRENDWWRDGVKTGDMLIQLIKSSPGPSEGGGCLGAHVTTHAGKHAGILEKKNTRSIHPI